MKIECQTDHDQQKWQVQGNLTIYEARELQRAFQQVLDVGGPLELDLSQVESCDTAGLQVLAAACRSAHKRQRVWTIRTLSEPVKKKAAQIGLALDGRTANAAGRLS